jgi:hypothetical protein
VGSDGRGEVLFRVTAAAPGSISAVPTNPVGVAVWCAGRGPPRALLKRDQ